MNEFDISVPNETDFNLDIMDKSLYNYDYGSYSLSPLQETAGLVVADELNKKLAAHFSDIRIIEQLLGPGNIELVADVSDIIQKKINDGTLGFMVNQKNGDTLAILRNLKTGRLFKSVPLKAKEVKELGNLPELSAVQGQLASIADEIEDLNKLVGRVEQGQYNDRFAGFFSARQKIIEGLSAEDDQLRRQLLISAITENNSTISKLQLSIYSDANDFINMKTMLGDSKRIDNLLQTTIGYLNSTVQLNVVAYTAMGEKKPLLAVVKNYQAFIGQTLLQEIDDTGKTVAWRIDNAHKGNDGKFLETSNEIYKKINNLIRSVNSIELGEQENEKIETENKDM